MVGWMDVVRNLRLTELLMGAPGLPLATKLLDNAKVFTAAMIFTFFTVPTHISDASADFCRRTTSIRNAGFYHRFRVFSEKPPPWV